MISVNGNSWEETDVNKRLVQKIKQEFKFSENISKLLINRNYNQEEIYSLNEIVSGDSIFCATGITSGDLVKGISVNGNTFISETLVTHKKSNFKKNVSKTYDI